MPTDHEANTSVKFQDADGGIADHDMGESRRSEEVPVTSRASPNRASRFNES